MKVIILLVKYLSNNERIFSFELAPLIIFLRFSHLL